MSDLSERVAALEARAAWIDSEIANLKSDVSASRSRSEQAMADFSTLMERLANLTVSLQEHKDWHGEQKQNGFSWIQAITAVGMIALAIMEFMK